MTNFNTEQMLIMRYGFTPLIPLEKVASDYLPPLTKPELHRKAKHGQLGFSVVNNGSESKPAYYVPSASLAIVVPCSFDSSVPSILRPASPILWLLIKPHR